MNIVITLPQELWLKIVSGERFFEMRKWQLPLKFNRKYNVIYVTIKEHKYIAGYFEVGYSGCCFDRKYAWIRYGYSLGISEDDFDKYWGKDEYRKTPMFFFLVKNVKVFSILKRSFCNPPKKFFYTSLNLL